MNEDIIIKRLEHGFDVWVGDKHTEQLTHEEMLGVVIAMTSTAPIFDRYKPWLKTSEEHEAAHNTWMAICNEQKTEV